VKARRARRAAAGDAKVAVAYLRVSTDDQKLGPEAQREQIETWASREGAKVAAWHFDRAVSGGTEIEDRPQLREALDSLVEHRAGVFVVAKRDRIARDEVIAGLIGREVARRGARVISADGVGNGDSPAEGFMRVILDGAAKYEREVIRARIRAALGVKRRRGELTGSPPWGSKIAADGKTLEPDEYEQGVIARVAELRAAKVSLRGIVEQLRDEGVTTRSGGPINLAQVQRINERSKGGT
jgi:DNA invertase Pin-like site-specific DNA recombinase